MPRSSGFSDFQKGIIIGYHKCGRSLRDISSDLKYPKLTVAYVIKKWKVNGDCRNVPRVGRPKKLGDRDRRVLSREIRKNCTQPMALIREEFQQASGSIVSMNTIRKEAHLLGFHGRATVHKPLITKSNRAARLVWCKAHRNSTVDHWKRVLWSDESRFTLYRSDGRVWVWRLPGERLLPECIVPRVKFGGGGIMVWGVSPGMGWDPWSPFMGVNGHGNLMSSICGGSRSCNLGKVGEFPTLVEFEYLYFCKYRLRVWLISDNFIFQSKYLYFSVMFSDEASCHLSGIVNRHNVRIWGSEYPHEYREAQRDSPKVNVWCGLMHDRDNVPFFSTEKTVSSVVYLLENFVFPQLEKLQPHVFLQQDGAPPHRGTIVRSSLNDHFTGR
ncbi:Transposable element Tc1 transposase, partial [Stegodyphus mimosarum]